jgi:hypothetical protein
MRPRCTRLDTRAVIMSNEAVASKWRVVHSQHPLFFLLYLVLAQPGSTAVYS